MALNVFKKVFSFGRKTVEEQPAEDRAPQVAPETVAAAAAPDVGAPPSAEPPPLPPAPQLDSTDHFPEDGEMRFTPETSAEEALEPAAPVDADHAGEPPIVAEDRPEPPTPAPEFASEQPSPEEPAPDVDMKMPRAAGLEEPEAEPESTEAADELEQAIETIEDSLDDIAAAADEAVDESLREPDEPADLPPESEPPAAGLSEAPPSPRPSQVRVGREVSGVEQPAEMEPDGQAVRLSWWQRLRQGLSRSSTQLSSQVTGIFTRRKLDEDTLQDLEDVLIQADLGVETALRITDTLSAGRYGRDISSKEVAQVMAGEIEKVLAPVARPLELDLSHKPHVILVVGVNGTGKTTTIGKLAAKLTAGGLKVTLGAGDTFRAAAIEQLKIWGERTNSEVVSTKLGADAAGLAYEAIARARENGSDVVIVDTAGRLQNKAELMDELAKVVRVIGKLDPDAPHTVLQTLDATTGQNALQQVEIFRNVAGVNGLVMTKLDGTARGGILVAIAAKHKLPVYFIGVGEGVEDLEPFEARDFATAIVGETE